MPVSTHLTGRAPGFEPPKSWPFLDALTLARVSGDRFNPFNALLRLALYSSERTCPVCDALIRARVSGV